MSASNDGQGHDPLTGCFLVRTPALLTDEGALEYARTLKPMASRKYFVRVRVEYRRPDDPTWRYVFVDVAEPKLFGETQSTHLIRCACLQFAISSVEHSCYIEPPREGFTHPIMHTRHMCTNAPGASDHICSCEPFKAAQQSGTDNEGFAALICRWPPDAPDEPREQHWAIGTELPPIKFCPWCGKAVPA